MHQATNIEGLDERCDSRPITAYVGFDCTANSLHIGSLVQIMMLRQLQNKGHKPIVLMGGGTTKIGDPSGKDEARPLLSDQDISNNKAGIFKIFEKYLRFGDNPSDAIMIDNADWLEPLSYIRFLRDYGSHFSVNRMLNMDSVKIRLEREQNLSFLEFNYAILQAYDFMELRRRYGCELQMGGSDQWGNIITGIDLARRVDKQEIFGLTSPLITTSSGAKMGKSANGAIWLNEERLSSFDFWQYWRNSEDADVERFLKLFTELPLDEIQRLGALQGAETNDAKIVLANEVTKLCHGEINATNAAKTAFDTFDSGMISDGLPQLYVSAENLNTFSLLDAFVQLGLADSKGAVRRLIRGGGAKLNNQPIIDEEITLSINDFGEMKKIQISAGKKRHGVLNLKK